MRYIYYPGCNGETISKQLDMASRKVAEVLGIKFEYLEELSCCGAVQVPAKDEELWLTLNARNFAIAEQKGQDIMTICNTCFYSMNKAIKMLQDRDILAQINENLRKIGLKYFGKVKVKHFLEFLIDEYPKDKFSKKIVKPLVGINVAPFYGCHILRPSGITGAEKQGKFEVFIKILGATPINFSNKYDCCGLHTMMINEKNTKSIVKNIVGNAGLQKADCITTPCTLCQFAIDSNQGGIGYNKKMSAPFFTQLIGLALGLERKEVGLSRNFTVSKNFLQKLKRIYI